jgi:HlyD family secretion protein
MVTNKQVGRSWNVLALIAFVAGVVLGGLGVHFFRGKDEAPPQVTRPIKKSGKVTALGRLEPKGGVVSLGIPVPDRLQEILPGIREETEVKKDQPLAKMESYAARKLDVDLIGQQLAEAQAKLEGVTEKIKAQIKVDEIKLQQLKELGPFDIQLQKHKVQGLKKQLAAAQDTMKRLKGLGSTVSQQEIEQQGLRVFQAQTELKIGEDALEKMNQGKDLELKAAEAQLAASKATLISAQKEAPIETLKGQKKLAELRLKDSILTAPMNGTILKILARPGELVGGQQPILQLGDTAQMEAVAEVYETDIARVQVGDKARITGRALPKDKQGKEQALEGTVVFIGSMVGKNKIFDVDPRAEVDRRTIQVRIRLADSAPAAKLINHQVNVQIDTKEASGP